MLIRNQSQYFIPLCFAGAYRNVTMDRFARLDLASGPARGLWLSARYCPNPRPMAPLLSQ